MSVDNMFSNLGYTKASSDWSEAFIMEMQWMQINANTVIGIAGTDCPENDEYFIAPINLSFPCMVTVYHGPFYEGWNINHGTFPLCEYWEDDQFNEYKFDNVDAALEFASRLS